MICVLFNLGNRDVQLAGPVAVNGEVFEGIIPPGRIREIGEYPARSFDTISNVIRLPIIEPVMGYLAERHSDIRVILVITDQRDPKVNAQDTVHFGTVVKRWLETYRFQGNVRVTKVEIWRFADKNPADFDIANRWYRDRFENLAKRAENERLDRLYVSLSGGTPAMNTMALLHAVASFGKRAEFIYMSVHEQRPIALGLGADLYARDLAGQVETLAQYGQFHAAGIVARSMSDIIRRGDLCRVLLHVLDAAHSRRCSEFVTAQQHLDEAVKLCPERREQLSELRRTYELPESKAALVAELYIDARAKLKEAAFKDFLVRVFQIQEELYRLQAERAGTRFEDPDKKRLDMKWLNAEPALRHHLESYRINGAPLRYQNDANRTVLQAILEFYGQTRSDIAEFLQCAGRLDALSQLRNRSVHGFRAVTKNLIEERYAGGVDAMISDLRVLGEKAGWDLGQREEYVQKTVDVVRTLLRDILS